MFQFFKTTALGGFVYLIPVIILVFIYVKAHELVGEVASPFLAIMTVKSIVGITVAHLVTVAVGVLICLLAGLAANLPVAVKLVARLESKILSNIPGYDLEKTKVTAQMRLDEERESNPVLVRFDDQWQIGFAMDNIAGGKVAVYLPGAPDPWSGSVSIVTEDRITHLDSKLNATMGIFKKLGYGAGDQLQTCMEKS